MYEYQVNVHLNGKFFFRTDWMDARTDAVKVAQALCEKFGADCVTVRRRNAVMQSAKGMELFAQEAA
ncbi:hypothetical protein M3795_25495 [Ralstonia pickettii]|uniref:hypothetical protein n=1 Tax=Ralstonia pickettii TaxID=329 RepID=UPI0020401B8F|nr:hypothetical protein [Ralstonia pickettii]MCM3583830.1 hypothetical protein [Ralstonia pickettii]